MADINAASAFTYRFPDGADLRLDPPGALRGWTQAEYGKWTWVSEKTRPALETVSEAHDALYRALLGAADRWSQTDNPTELQRIRAGIATTLDEYYQTGRILHSDSSKGRFVFRVRDTRGPRAGAGAYAAVLAAQFHLGGDSWTEFIEGIIEGFLYKREIEWTATLHREQLELLCRRYSEENAKQTERAQAIAERNQQLNEQFTLALKEKAESFQKLHEQQASAFAQQKDEHAKRMAVIEDTFRKELRLKAPVGYWRNKESHHRKRWIGFGIATAGAGLALVVGMVALLHWVFGGLPATQSPEHWRPGVVLVGAFVSVWGVRVFLRLTFSHLHLATDAFERQYMLNTFLSLTAEGAQFAPDDKKLVLDHLFQSASDGLVRDDAVPPTLLEKLTS